MADSKKKPNGEATMADTKNKSNGQTPSPQTPKGSKFAERWSKIINLCSEIKNDPAGALDYEKTVEDNTTLRISLKKRDDELQTLKSEVEQLKLLGSHDLERFGKKYAEFEYILKDAESSRTALASTTTKLEETNKQIKKLECDNKQLEKRTRDMETARKHAERDLADTQDRLRELENKHMKAQQKISFYGEDNLVSIDLDKVGHDLEEFAEKCHQVVMGCFEPCEAPPRNISSLIDYVDRCPGRHVRLPLPLTDHTTKSARLMRCAAAELVIANTMVEHIFTDIYVPNDIDRQKALASALELLASTDPRREALVRCQLLETCDADAQSLDSICQAAFEEVCAALDGLLPAGEPRDKFHAGLSALLGEALELWHPLQWSRTRISAHLFVSPKMLNRSEDAYPDYDGVNPQSAGGGGLPGSQPVMLLFPLIYSSGRAVICPPTALWSDQGAFIDASNEASEDRLTMAGSMVGAVDSTRSSAMRRRLSVGARQPASQPASSSLPPSGVMNGASGVSGSHLVPTRSRENGIKLNGAK
ncbi:hypothetical protein GE09DRAFT_285463 [Coniochaeta sp. 2T2.1]|nr:hypothetical protein GE09DRAFT_285463 [Coniochaeta sp. 2T2.1]